MNRSSRASRRRSCRSLDGVVCGHIHKAESRTDGDFADYNCGDWVEGGTALVEHEDGRLQIIDAIALTTQLKAQARSLREAKGARARAAEPVAAN